MVNFNKKDTDKLARDLVRRKKQDMQREMDKFYSQHKRKPVATIKPALKRMWERDGGKLTDPELTEYATTISEGKRIQFTMG